MVVEVMVSKCGSDFDEYVGRTLGSWAPTLNPITRTVTNLWHERKLKIHHAGEWKEGRVRSWTQSVDDPQTDEYSKWSLELEIVNDASEHDDDDKKQKIDKSAGEADSEGRNRTIPLDEEENHTVMTFSVNRMNIEGGGTLKSATSESDELFSLEWMQPAEPAIDLNLGVLSYSCPYCRAVEPVVAAHDDQSLTRSDECPVCLETCECRVLQCGHGVCHSCWASYRRAAILGSVELDELDLEDLENERAERNSIFFSDGHEADMRALYHHRIADLAATVNDVSTGTNDLKRFYQEVMVESPLVWVIAIRVFHLYDDLCVEGLKILFHVIQDRKDEIIATVNRGKPGTDGEALFHSACCDIIGRIESFYLEAEMLRFVIPWTELAAYHLQRSLNQGEVGVTEKSAGLMHLKYGQLKEAMRSYEACLELKPDDEDAREGREDVLLEMKEWTGTSGKLTPGC